MSIETNAPGHAAHGVAMDREALGALDWTPSLQVQVGGWTWRADPEDGPSAADAGNEAREQRQLVRAFAMAPLLLG